MTMWVTKLVVVIVLWYRLMGEVVWGPTENNPRTNLFFNVDNAQASLNYFSLLKNKGETEG